MTKNHGPILIVLGCLLGCGALGFLLMEVFHRTTAENPDVQTYRRHLEYPPADIDTAVLQIMDCEAIAKREWDTDLKYVCTVRGVEILPFVRDDCGEVCRLSKFSAATVPECGCAK